MQVLTLADLLNDQRDRIAAEYSKSKFRIQTVVTSSENCIVAKPLTLDEILEEVVETEELRKEHTEGN